MSFSKFANVVSRLPYEVPDSRIGESKNLGVFDRLASQAFVCDSAFHVYYVSNLVEEPGIDSAEFRDFFDGHPGFESFNRVEDSLVCWLTQFLSDPSGTSTEISYLSEFSSQVQHSYCFLEGFLEASSDRHDLTDGLHLGADSFTGVPELSKVPAGSLYDNVVQRGLEAGTRDSCYFVGKLGKGVANG